MKLEFEGSAWYWLDETTIYNPTEEDIVEAFSTVQWEENDEAKLIVTPGHYMRAFYDGSSDPYEVAGFKLSFSEGSLFNRYACLSSLTLDQVIEAFKQYLRKDESFKKKYTWFSLNADDGLENLSTEIADFGVSPSEDSSVFSRTGQKEEAERESSSPVGSGPDEQKKTRKTSSVQSGRENEGYPRGMSSGPIDYLLSLTPHQFEDAIAALFDTLGYSVVQTPYSGDGGLDLIVGRNGVRYGVECKRYDPTSNSVGRRDLQIFYAALQENELDGGYVVTTSTFTQQARGVAENFSIELIGERPLELMMKLAYPYKTR